MTALPSVRWRDGEMTALNIEPACHLAIQNNLVTIDIDGQRFEDRYFTALAMRAYDTARATVDLLCFATGNGLTFLLETWIDPNGITRPVASIQPALGELATAVNGGSNFNDALWILLSDPLLFIALRGLIDGITQWHQAPITAARSIERLRNLVMPGEKDRRKQWKKLGEVLQLAETYTKLIRDTSIGPRHGDPTHIPGAITTEVATRAWIIMNRYFEFRKRGGVNPLPASDFPLLT
jgi:hypothetical protein